VQVEKMLDDAARTADKTTSATEPAKQGKSTSSSALAFPENYAAATATDAATPRKN
jgi:penicillin-binding protein 1A